MFTISFIGAGNRGGVYARYFAKSPDVKIVSVCDIAESTALAMQEKYGLKPENVFTDEEEFFKEKRSDVLVIATLDDLHRRQTVRALSMGYDVLLEKPIAPNAEDVQAIADAAKKYQRQVVICHNLRYTPFYQRIKMMLNDGTLGDVVSVEQSENVAYHHFMLSFIRGNWRREDETSPIILQKCCHDLDIIYWLIGKKCTGLSSYGSLRYYTKENRPDYASEYCSDCPKKDCAYNAVEFFKKYGSLPDNEEKTEEKIVAHLNGATQPKGKCVFACDNDVCDRQVVNMRFEGGVTANLLMHGFCAPRTDRITKVYGSKGCVVGNLDSGLLTVTIFGQDPYVIDVNGEILDNSHLGGDSKLVQDYIVYKNGGARPLGVSLIEDSVYSHKLAFAAENSRLAGGKIMEV